MDDSIYIKLVNLKDNNNVPNILLYGECLTGKKTILQNFINYVYKTQEVIDKYVILLNCSHGKGNIKFIRETIKYFSNTVINKNDNVDFKMIVLTNADKLTYDAQSALRRCIEIYNISTRFFIVIDDKNKLMKPILSRFSHIYVNNRYDTVEVNFKKHNDYIYSKIKKILNDNQEQQENKDISCNYNCNYKNILENSNKLYMSGVSADMLLKYIDKHLEDSLDKYKFLLFFNNYKINIRNEEFLIFLALLFYYNNYNIDID